MKTKQEIKDRINVLETKKKTILIHNKDKEGLKNNKNYIYQLKLCLFLMDDPNISLNCKDYGYTLRMIEDLADKEKSIADGIVYSIETYLEY